MCTNRHPITQPSPRGEPGGEASKQTAFSREGFKPLRVVLDRTLRLPRDAHLLDGSAPTLVLHAPDALPADDRYACAELAPIAVDAVRRLSIGETLSLLAARGVNELQVEAGATLCGALFAQHLVDELLLYVAPVMLGDRARALLELPPLADMEQARRMRVVDQRQIGADFRFLLRE